MLDLLGSTQEAKRAIEELFRRKKWTNARRHRHTRSLQNSMIPRPFRVSTSGVHEEKVNTDNIVNFLTEGARRDHSRWLGYGPCWTWHATLNDRGEMLFSLVRGYSIPVQQFVHFG